MEDLLKGIDLSTIDTLQKKVAKRGNEWCVFHGSGPREGKVIKCFPTKEKALAMHRAIMAEKQRRAKKSELLKKMKVKYLSVSKPYYRFELAFIHRDIEKAKWDTKQLLIDAKIDGLRVTAVKIDGKANVLVDPQELKKKSPIVSERIPEIIKEIEANFPDNTVVDGEFYAAKGNTALHRTDANAILNSKISAQRLSPFAFLFVFDVIYYKSEDVRKNPLIERLKLLSTFKSTKHVNIEDASSKLEAGHSGYIVDGKNRKAIDKAINLILSGKHGLQKKIEEGIMLKVMQGSYYGEETTKASSIIHNKTWAKAKRFHEVDTIVLGKKLVKGQTRIWNYLLGIKITSQYAEKMLEDIKAYKRVACLIGKKLYQKKECKDYLNRKGVLFLQMLGKSDNTKIQCDIRDVLRCASEEILYNENKTNPEYPYFTGYINVALEPIPERKTSDDLAVLRRLSLLEPQRIPVEELARLKGEKLPKDVMKYVKHIQTLSSEDIEKFLERLRKKLLEIDNK